MSTIEIPEPDVTLAARPTPLHRLDAFSEAVGADADLYVKRDDMTAGVGQGNKIRKLEYLLGDAIEEGADAVITMGGAQSNHCRSTAVGARQLGLYPHLLLRGAEPDVYDGNLLLDRILDAGIEWITGEDFGERRAETFRNAAQELRDTGYAPYTIPVGGSNGVGSLGYLKAYAEIHEWARSNDVSFDRIFFPTGSGGTQSGLLAGTMLFDADTRVVGVNVGNHSVSEITDHVEHNLDEMDTLLDEAVGPLDGRSAVEVLTDYRGPGYAEPTEADLDIILEAGRKAGLVLDPTYTAKAFRAFIEESRPGETNLFVHTGGSYGLFPKRELVTDRWRGQLR